MLSQSNLQLGNIKLQSLYQTASLDSPWIENEWKDTELRVISKEAPCSQDNQYYF